MKLYGIDDARLGIILGQPGPKNNRVFIKSRGAGVYYDFSNGKLVPTYCRKGWLARVCCDYKYCTYTYGFCEIERGENRVKVLARGIGGYERNRAKWDDLLIRVTGLHDDDEPAIVKVNPIGGVTYYLVFYEQFVNMLPENQFHREYDFAQIWVTL